MKSWEGSGEDPERIIAIVRRCAGKYYPDEATAEEEIHRSGKHVQMFELKIEHLSGKEVQANLLMEM